MPSLRFSGLHACTNSGTWGVRSCQSIAQVLRAFYLELRAKAPAADGAPITTRQLESLIRLTEARARADLRTTATQCAPAR